MELNVYNVEKFERGKWWYVIFAFIMVLVIAICIFYTNWTGIVLMFLILGGYIYYGLINVYEIKMKITDEGLLVGEKLIPWTTLTGYSLEINKSDQQIKNIVLISEKHHSIYTISDTVENIKSFLAELDNYVEIVGEYDQTKWDKLARILKL